MKKPLRQRVMDYRSISTRAKMAAWHLRDPRRARRVRHYKQRATAYIEDAMRFAALSVLGRQLYVGCRTDAADLADCHYAVHAT